MLKLNRLLYSSVNEAFFDTIAPTERQYTALETAKNLIRDYLRPAIRESTVSVLGLSQAVTPRFRTQGSWKYRTCVQPAWMPPQQIDWDFGVYLPVSVWEDNGPPHKMAQLYFRLVEGLLEKLCRRYGWHMVPGKDTCIRVQVTAWGHIDVPLYAVPEKEFEQIMERALRANQLRKAANDSFARMDAAVELEEQEWAELDSIVLATRSGEWKSSDPEAVCKWYLDRIEEHNEQLRRVCTYLKAWRDYHWKDGDGPTSVAIMVAIAQAFECFTGRDDLALEHAARTLARSLKGDIREDGIDQGAEDFNRRLNEQARQDASSKAQALVDALKQARSLTVGYEVSAITLLRAHLGDRLPASRDLVDADSGADSVRSVPARTVPAPLVRSTKAG
jgi:hypothetical protein